MSKMVRVVALSALCGLAGCAGSNPDLKPAIDGFATAAKASQASLQSYEQAMDAAMLQANLATALSGQGTVRPLGKDCRLHAERCRIVLVIGTAPDQRQASLDSEPVDPLARRIMAGIVDYAANLQTIAAIDTEAGVKNATDATLANVKQFATDVDSAAKDAGKTTSFATTVGAYATPLSDAATFILGHALAAQKLAAMRKATKAMEAILPDLITVCEASVEASVDPTREKLLNAFNTAETNYAARRDSAAALDALRAAAADYDKFLTGKPDAALEDLKTAHAKLAKALLSDNPDFGEALAAFQATVAAAQKAKAIIDEFNAAAHPK